MNLGEYPEYSDMKTFLEEIDPTHKWEHSIPHPYNPKQSQEGGDHYKKYGDYQPWQVFAKWMSPEELKGYMKGTVIAYLAREQDKGGELDIKKALHTIQLYLEVKQSNL